MLPVLLIWNTTRLPYSKGFSLYKPLPYSKAFSFSRAEALQSILQLMGEKQMFEYYQDDYKVHAIDWTMEKAKEVLQAWQRKFSKVCYICGWMVECFSGYFCIPVFIISHLDLKIWKEVLDWPAYHAAAAAAAVNSSSYHFKNPLPTPSHTCTHAHTLTPTHTHIHTVR